MLVTVDLRTGDPFNSGVQHFYVCIMAGGSGERFWPLSRKSTPKHLLRLFSDHTLLEETVRRVEAVIPLDHIFVLTNNVQLEAIRAEVPFLPAGQILAEPASRDTAPACALGTALVRARDPQAVVAFLPADHLIRDVATFARQLREAAVLGQESGAVITFGIQPTYAATGFGYLQLGAPLERPAARTKFFAVDRFVEKPDQATAESYLARGNFGWNAGMFLWTSDVFLNEARAHCPELAEFIEKFPADPAEAIAYTAEAFPKLPKISVDYAIMEKAARVISGRAEFDWDDVGCWTALPAHLPQDAGDNTVRGPVVIHNATGNIVIAGKRLIALSGVHDLVVVETDDAILVCHRDEAQNLKSIHKQLPDNLR